MCRALAGSEAVFQKPPQRQLKRPQWGWFGVALALALALALGGVGLGWFGSGWFGVLCRYANTSGYEAKRQHAADRDSSTRDTATPTPTPTPHAIGSAADMCAGAADRRAGGGSGAPWRDGGTTPVPDLAAERHESTDEIMSQLCGMGMDFDTVSACVASLQPDLTMDNALDLCLQVQQGAPLPSRPGAGRPSPPGQSHQPGKRAKLSAERHGAPQSSQASPFKEEIGAEVKRAPSLESGFFVQTVCTVPVDSCPPRACVCVCVCVCVCETGGAGEQGRTSAASLCFVSATPASPPSSSSSSPPLQL